MCVCVCVCVCMYNCVCLFVRVFSVYVEIFLCKSWREDTFVCSLF